MRQVPENKKQFSYLIVGNGKLSKHFQRYFTLKNVSYKVWTHHSDETFKAIANNTNKILVLIKDDEIETFILSNQKLVSKNKLWIHCSGMFSSNFAESAHPLMTFTDKLYDLKFYEDIIFITEKGRKTFKELFPELNNPNYQIESSQKILYHAFCVMSGNFTTMLWQFFFDYLERNNIPKTAAYQFLKATTDNLISVQNPLTGPISRKDKKVISAHLESLTDHPLKAVYQSMLDVYEQMKEEKILEIN